MFEKHEIRKKALLGIYSEAMVTIQKQLTAEVYVTFICVESLSITYLVSYQVLVCLHCCGQFHSESQRWKNLYVVSYIYCITSTL